MVALSTGSNAPHREETSQIAKQVAPIAATESIAKLGWILIRHRWISAAQLHTTLTQQPSSSKKLGELLLEKSLISENQLNQALQEQYWRRNGYWVIG
ncbi:hypothetical protein [Leptolyngbya sp. NK1-12]|uniref:hypothetical protein n=1 Tax=Leptolyngbya sp. NK1-12 TaxID=2547451 RepID=UPI002931DA8B|nr:hypothetical protein [Leptolyngbya sp. NK1-12]